MMGPDWPYYIMLDRDDWPDIQDWCVVNIGEFDQAWYKLGIDPLAHLEGDRRTHWFFKQQKHATLFALRWL